MIFSNLFGKKKPRQYPDTLEIVDNKVTLQALCDALEVEIPMKLKGKARKSFRVAFKPTLLKPGDIYLCVKTPEALHIKNKNTKDYFNDAIEKGASVIIIDKKRYKKYGLNDKRVPVILLDNTTRQVTKFFGKIRNAYDSKVVMITGSVGKTTTKDLCYAVTKNHFNTYASEKNGNTIYRSANHMYREYGRNGNNLLIQESGAGRRGSVRFASEMLTPDIFVLTNVYKHHFQVYKTMENLFEDKTSPDDNIRGNGIVVTNFDDEKIRNHHFKHRVISFAVDYEDVDYRAVNIHQELEYLCFDIYERATDTTIPIKVQLLGVHNAYNATAAFIVAKNLGMTNEDIQRELANYHTEGVRQNLQNVGGVYIDMDCYNVAEESIMTMLKSGEDFPIDTESKRIALIGGENKLGDDVRQRSLEFGKKLGEVKFDSFLLCGSPDETKANLNKYGDAQSLYKGFTSVSDTDCRLCTNLADMENYLRHNVKTGDLLMVKGIYLLDMAIAVDKAFGTSYSFDLNYYQKEMVSVDADGYSSNMIPRFDRLEITSAPVTDGAAVIPDEIEGNPVFRLKNEIFKDNADVKSVDLGSCVMNIGAGAFAGTEIEEIVIPDSVLVIEDGAFSGCKNLKSVVIGKGVTHIGADAFANCSALEKVDVPVSVKYIGKNAFPTGGDCTIVCEDGSFAFDYAADNTIKFELK